MKPCGVCLENEYPEGLYYDTVSDHLVELRWQGTRFILTAEFDEVFYEGKSKRGGDPAKAGLFLIDKTWMRPEYF